MGKKLGNYIKANRERLNISQRELSEYLKLSSPQFISNIERGVAPIPTKMLGKLSKKLKIDVDDIIELMVEEARTELKKAVRKVR